MNWKLFFLYLGAGVAIICFFLVLISPSACRCTLAERYIDNLLRPVSGIGDIFTGIGDAIAGIGIGIGNGIEGFFTALAGELLPRLLCALLHGETYCSTCACS